MASVTLRENKREEAHLRQSISFARSQLILFQSRKKFAFLYCLATVTGLFSLPGVIDALLAGTDFLTVVGRILPLPLASLLITAGTYILNDLVDVDLDKANGKRRPVASGLISRRQSLAFVALTFGSSIVLGMIAFSPISMIVVGSILAIGIMYSLPKIALMKRFVIKTGSIAVFYILCALLGMTSIYNLDSAMDNPVRVVTILLTLAIAVFISSTLNDMGDVDGDKAAGRRTIPIVIGKDNTIKLTVILAIGILAINWTLYGATLAAGGEGGLATVSTISAFALVIAAIMSKMSKQLHDADSMRKQHKKLFPLQMSLHPILIAGTMML